MGRKPRFWTDFTCSQIIDYLLKEGPDPIQKHTVQKYVSRGVQKMRQEAERLRDDQNPAVQFFVTLYGRPLDMPMEKIFELAIEQLKGLKYVYETLERDSIGLTWKGYDSTTRAKKYVTSKRQHLKRAVTSNLFPLYFLAGWGKREINPGYLFKS